MVLNQFLLRPFGGYEHAIYFIYSSLFLLTRVIIMTLFASSVHTASMNIAPELYDVPSSVGNEVNITVFYRSRAKRPYLFFLIHIKSKQSKKFISNNVSQNKMHMAVGTTTTLLRIIEQKLSVRASANIRDMLQNMVIPTTF